MKIVEKVISGGQTGADQGGLEAASSLGIPRGGHMPKGFRTENGPRGDFAALHGMRQTQAESSTVRTRLNAQNADATLLFGDAASSGSRLTIGFCRELGRPCMAVRDGLPEALATRLLTDWLRRLAKERGRPLTINIAGNRESVNPGIGKRTRSILTAVLRQLEGDGETQPGSHAGIPLREG